MSEQNSRKVLAQWDLASEVWDLRMGRDGDWFNKSVLFPAILSLLPGISRKRILDAGCGNGFLSRQLASQGAIVTGIDISEGLLKKARAYEVETYLGISYIHGDLCEAVSYFDSSVFDYILCNMVIQDIPNYEAALHSLASVLRENGRLIVSTYHPCFLASSVKLGWEIRVKQNKKVSSGPGLTHLEAMGELYGIVHKMDDYFQTGQFIREWTPGIITVSFRRTLGDYVIAIRNAGFTITHILEPVPTEVGVSQSLYIESLLQRIPHFIVFELAVTRKL